MTARRSIDSRAVCGRVERRAAVATAPVGALTALVGVLATLALLAALTGCGSSDAPPGKPPPVTVEPTDEVDVTPAPRSAGREWRRMDLDQLTASIERISAGIRWTELDEEGQEFDVFASLAGSLGKPDFLNNNVEDLQPALLFQKFLDDAATSVCDKWIDREQTLPASQRVLVVQADFSATPETAPEAIDADLAAALLRFHGRSVDPADPEFAPWRQLFTDVWQRTGRIDWAWRTACVALFTHPRFYTY